MWVIADRNQKCSFFSLLAAAKWAKSSEPLLHLSPWQQKTLGLPNNQLATSVTVLACNQVQVAVVDASVAVARAAAVDHDAVMFHIVSTPPCFARRKQRRRNSASLKVS